MRIMRPSCWSQVAGGALMRRIRAIPTGIGCTNRCGPFVWAKVETDAVVIFSVGLIIGRAQFLAQWVRRATVGQS